jgi:hypothetical protein
MFRLLKIIAVSFVVLVVIAAFWINQRNVNAARGGVKGPVEYDFPQGGTVTLDLTAGDYEIRGMPDNKIRIRYSYARYLNDTASINAKINGSDANISISGPGNSGFHVVIQVPQKSHLKTDLTAGKLVVNGVEGNKDLDANAGSLTIEVADPHQYRDVSLSLLSGKIEARPWHADRGGLFRHFAYHNAASGGSYHINANLLAGKLSVETFRDFNSDPQPPQPPQSPQPTQQQRYD